MSVKLRDPGIRDYIPNKPWTSGSSNKGAISCHGETTDHEREQKARMHAFSIKYFSLSYLPLATSLEARIEAKNNVTEAISMGKLLLRHLITTVIQAISYLILFLGIQVRVLITNNKTD